MPVVVNNTMLTLRTLLDEGLGYMLLYVLLIPKLLLQNPIIKPPLGVVMLDPDILICDVV